MIKFILRFLKFLGSYSLRTKFAFVLSFFENTLKFVPIFVAWDIFTKILSNTVTLNDAWISGVALLASLLIRCLLQRAFLGLESGAGVEFAARERIAIGDRFKRFPMSFFTEGNLGNVTSVVTVDLTFIEETGMGILHKVVNGLISIVFGCIMLVIVDWRVGLVSVVVFAASQLAFRWLQRVGTEQSKIRQRQQASLVATVVEYIKGLPIIKSFNMAGDKAKAVKDTIEKTRDHAIGYEEKAVPPVSLYLDCFAIGTALTVLLATSFGFYGSMDLSVVLMFIIFIFYIYAPAKALGAQSQLIRVMEAGLDRYEALQKVVIIDEDGRDIALERFDIEFKHVDFSYEESETLKNISFKVPEKSMTALVGASGSGKTTVTNLITRFWDVQQGEVLLGGVNVKQMTCDSLLKNISMVFQKVYLFKDTVMNNIKFGKPDATYEEVVAAAKKARCHDFISQLPNGYDTLVGEGGSTLSGGEKQRISIARAILKDAPIILLDEATASVDPDNEKHIQMAISELVKDKTLVVIAHRLSTIRNADQILVLDEGRLIQTGTHAELMEQEGQYRNLWEKRITARGWKITAKAR
jgi:ATP-binding cassette subfamily B protein IrtB